MYIHMYMPRNLTLGIVVVRLSLKTIFVSSVGLFLILNYM